MAATKTTRKKGTRSSSSRRKKKQGSQGGFQNEIILLIVMAASIILLVSDFGLGGFVGNAISGAFFGVMGLMAYVFPVALFLGTAFLLSNKSNPAAYKKAAAFCVLFLVLCGLVQLLTEGYVTSNTLMDYYRLCSDYRTGGGLLGGAICISLTSAFGTVGGWVILILVILVCLILITQKSLFGFLGHAWDGLLGLIQSGRQRYQEGQPERERIRQLKSQQRQLARQERQAQRVRRLEEAIAAEEAADQEGQPGADARRRRTRGGGEEFGAFLSGTSLLGEEKGQELTIESSPAQQGQLEFAIQRGEESQPLEEPEEEEGLLEAEKALAEEKPSPAAEEIPQKAAKNPRSSKAEMEKGVLDISQEIKSQESPVKKEYQFPPLRLLKRGNGKSQGDSDAYLRKTAQKLQDTLHNFGVNVNIVNVSCGPTVTRYELQPEQGVKVSRIVGLADDIKLNLAAADIRIEAPIPGKAAVGIEVPNKENSPVMLRDLLQSQEFQNAKSSLAFAAGKDIGGNPVVADIAKMPHLLIAGATGSGKSVCINTLIMSILYKAKPDEVKMIMIDPKVVELSVYNGIPHLYIPVVTDPKKAAGALNWAVTEMTNRYNAFAEYGVRNLSEFNKKLETMSFHEEEAKPDKMPQIVIIVDELADLMMVAPGEVEDAICRLAQLARAAGIHLIIATQRPSVNVITGLIKANMPSRIAFAVSSGVDSRTILDMNGAEKLLGKGDMLFYPQGYPKPARLQGAFVSDDEVSAVVRFLADKNPAASYSSQIQQQVNTGSSVLPGGGQGEERDVYFEDAGKFIIEKERASIGMLQRMFKIGFNRAARIMDQLTDAGVVGPEEGTKPRKVLMTMEEFGGYMEENP
ncbi:MAG: DNA translocase FtsK [Eubacteriales bacterium]|nr:DNA translocase FtsK [Eubacteriales bacterium]